MENAPQRGRAGWPVAAVWLLTPFAAGGIGALATAQAVSSWYVGLAKPSWTPPNWVFGPVWTLLYLLMGIAAVLVWRSIGPGRRFALGLFSVQLVLNALWPVVFFGLRAPIAGFVVIAVLWGFIVWLVARSYYVDRRAAWLLVPYLFWVTYAATLNLGIVLLN